mmetsp:Transcript_104099/g.155884  ORF Transcript_104099/g.155884 Transcript_104099/m.155884 type:complete len:136 (-) Transcript_104099:40-447(-)
MQCQGRDVRYRVLQGDAKAEGKSRKFMHVMREEFQAAADAVLAARAVAAEMRPGPEGDEPPSPEMDEVPEASIAASDVADLDTVAWDEEFLVAPTATPMGLEEPDGPPHNLEEAEANAVTGVMQAAHRVFAPHQA